MPNPNYAGGYEPQEGHGEIKEQTETKSEFYFDKFLSHIGDPEAKDFFEGLDSQTTQAVETCLTDAGGLYWSDAFGIFSRDENSSAKLNELQGDLQELLSVAGDYERKSEEVSGDNT